MLGPVLVGDVGGTRARFALAYKDAGGLTLERFEVFHNEGHASFGDVLASYVDGLDVRLDSALFAMAGPVRSDGSIKLTNRDWPPVVPKELGKRFGLSRVSLVNDFAAMARAIPEMPDEVFETVLDGQAEKTAPVIVTGPGTGFGVSTLIPLPGGRWHVLTGEGGHAAYAARTVREGELAERLAAEYGYVSTEMVVSGAWLQPIHDIVSDLHGRPRQALGAAQILELAEEGDPVAEEVCRLRARGIMGSAGDLVLINGGFGGVVLTGGVAERMVTWLQGDQARARFYDRGSHSVYMEGVPVRVLKEDTAPVIGAAALLFDQERDRC